jgi:hypothetical protein
MGKAENWQDKITQALSDTNITIFNPRRDDWDSSWVQDISNEKFKEPVETFEDFMLRLGMGIRKRHEEDSATNIKKAA